MGTRGLDRSRWSRLGSDVVARAAI